MLRNKHLTWWSEEFILLKLKIALSLKQKYKKDVFKKTFLLVMVDLNVESFYLYLYNPNNVKGPESTHGGIKCLWKYCPFSTKAFVNKWNTFSKSTGFFFTFNTFNFMFDLSRLSRITRDGWWKPQILHTLAPICGLDVAVSASKGTPIYKDRIFPMCANHSRNGSSCLICSSFLKVYTNFYSL